MSPTSIIAIIVGAVVIIIVADLIGHRMDRNLLRKKGRIFRQQRGPSMPGDRNVLHERNAEIWRNGGGL